MGMLVNSFVFEASGPPPPPGDLTVVQSAVIAYNSTALTLTLGAAPTDGNLLICIGTNLISAGSAAANAGWTIDANGGAHGTKFGTGVNGSDGSAGTVVLIPN